MAPPPESSDRNRNELDRKPRVGLTRVVLALAALWLADEIVGAALGFVRRVLTVVVIVVLVVVGWRVSRARKS